MGQLFDKAIRRGFSDIFDSAYGTSALENRLKGALASSLYDARLSSSGYNKARTKTVEDELANRQSLRGRLVEGGDANALDRFDMGPGHAQDYMKGRVGSRKDAQLVGELERLEGLGTPKAMDYRSGAITGSNRGQIGAGRLSEEKMAIARENEDALTAALGQVVEKGIDPNTKEGQSLLVNIMARGKAVSGSDYKNLLTTESAIGANEARAEKYKAQGLAALGSMESQRQYRERKLDLQKLHDEGKLDIGKIKATAYSDWKNAQSVLANEKVQVEKAKVHEIEISALLKENKIDKVKAEINNANSKTNAEIKRIDQLVSSGEIKDLEVRENTRLIGERMKTEVKKREKMSATIDKLHKQGDEIDAMIKKIRAQTKGEEVDMGLAFMEFLGLDTKTASGDSMRNNYTKMYVKIMKEDPILREPDPENKGQERDIVINRTDENPDGQKKLFSHLDAEKQKIYIQSRLIDERQESYAMTGKTLHPKVQALVDGMMESFTNEGSTGVADHLGNELNNMADGEEKTDNHAIAPKGVRDKLLNMSVQQDRISGVPGAAASAQSLIPPPAGDISNPDADMAAALSGGATAGAQATQPVAQDVPVDDVSAALGDVQNQQVPVQGANLAQTGEDAKAIALQKMVADNNWSPNIAALFSDAIATQKLAPENVQRIVGLSVVKLQKMIDDNKTNKEFATDIMPIIQQMIAEKKAGG